MDNFLRSVKTLKHHSTTVLFLVGFFVDMLILPDIDEPKAKYFGMAYLFSIGLLIMFREWIVSRNKATKGEQKIYDFSTFGIVCLLGSALSFVFIYCLRGADFSVSWPLIAMLAGIILSNEFVSTHSLRFSLDVGILFLANLFYVIFHLPVELKVQNDMIFALSIAIAIAMSAFYVYILKYISEVSRYEAPRLYSLAVGIPMFIGMLYFLNVLPAVPLSLKEKGIYHNIVRTSSGEFLAKGEAEKKNIFSYFKNPVYHLSNTDDGIYFFSSISAPAELTAPISHVWEFYDKETDKWKIFYTTSFSIQGGRTDGYRAYSTTGNLKEGLWRVTVKVGEGRIVGREKFTVIKSENVEIVDSKL